jgi:hypothetical protein
MEDRAVPPQLVTFLTRASAWPIVEGSQRLFLCLNNPAPMSAGPPAHDWTRGSPGIFHDLHNTWVAELKKVLNSGIFPPGYYGALSEQVAGQTAPDVIALELTPRPEGGPRIRSEAVQGKKGWVAATLPPPMASIITRTEGLSYAALRRTVVIRQVEGHQVVALIEILSRSKKAASVCFSRWLATVCGIGGCFVTERFDEIHIPFHSPSDHAFNEEHDYLGQPFIAFRVHRHR